MGAWQAGATPPPALAVEDPKNLHHWSPWVRAAVFDAEVMSRLGFGTEGASKHVMRVWHLEIQPQAGSPPTATYQPLVSLKRPTEAIFLKQLNLVNDHADLRPDRASEILEQMSNPGAFFSSIVFLHPDRNPYTMELIATALRLANVVEMRVKHALACRRPVELSPKIQPMVLTPAHGSLPSGHATEAFASAAVLWTLLRTAHPTHYGKEVFGQMLMRTAARIAINRTVAGVHFPVDSVAGAMLGLTLGHYFARRCAALNGYEAWSFDGSAYPAKADFNWHTLFDTTLPQQIAAAPYVVSAGAQPLASSSPALEWLWTRALKEWS
ncbi:phosphatase PAP2 family protein [Alsobacter sp. KACC 23698]|uniref:Phosphatase PAP2 family protein n=1 Tax=Alsobacter sp. KACC 23698 TaxID=3149229 RepID=A0AAU7JGW3_9HYPH